ncbi:MAG TPA: hypothetical protein VGD67_16990 [Pseudonocardiaceae bacterium]
MGEELLQIRIYQVPVTQCVTAVQWLLPALDDGVLTPFTESCEVIVGHTEGERSGESVTPEVGDLLGGHTALFLHCMCG